MDAAAEVRRLVERADEQMKAASNRADPGVALLRAGELLDKADTWLGGIVDKAERDMMDLLIIRRRDDLGFLVHGMTVPRVQSDSTDLPQPGPETLGRQQASGPERLPPNQRLLTTWPVLHVGTAPQIDRSAWHLTCTGRVEGHRQRLDIAQLEALGVTETVDDFHCVTGWSRFDNAWTGVLVKDLIAAMGVQDDVTHVIVNGANAYSANLDLATLMRDDAIIAWAHDGVALTADHGGPVRLIVPTRYAWKSVKWLEGMKFLDRDVPGYWEARGYHNVGDPFLEQRYA